MHDRLDLVLAGHKLFEHAVVDKAVLWVRLKDPVELDHIGNIFQIDQSQPVESQ